LPTYSFYGGQEILRFSAEEWKYYRQVGENWVPLDGVTGIVKLITPSKPLMVWAVRKALEKTKSLLMDGYVGEQASVLYESVLDDILERAKKADTEELENAGEIGHQAHDHVEQVIKSMLQGNEDRRLELLAKLPLDERASNGAIAAICWMAEHLVRWVSTERKVYDREHGFAGTCDGVAYVSSCNDPSCCPHPWIGERLSIIDWKTSNALRVGYLWQTAAYQHGIELEDNIQILDRWILRLDKETAEFDPWYRPGREAFEEDFQGFLNALATHRSLVKSEDWVSEIKAGRTAERRRVSRELKEEGYKMKCKSADKYKGVRFPKCNKGNPCQYCLKLYKEKHAADSTVV
jgi:hypothetical protein